MGGLIFAIMISVLLIGVLWYVRRQINEIKSTPLSLVKEGDEEKVVSLDPVPFKAKISPMTPTEQAFFQVLREVVGEDFYVCPMVRMLDVIEPAVSKQQERKRWFQGFSQVKSKHIDFVILDASLQVFCAIELNDSSHQRADRRQRDERITRMFRSAKVPLLFIEVAERYDSIKLAEQIATAVRE
jgi:hypothetical protein